MSNEPASATSTLVGSLPPGARLHEYQIEGVLGHGGFGITYLARDTHLDKKVAIKEYLPNDLAARAPNHTVTVRSPESSEAFKWGLNSFIKEARVLGKFSHPSLIQVHRYFEANDTAYFVMEYAEGVTLARVLKLEGNLSEERLRKILFPILNGLEEVHRHGILHRDIKPENIILREGAAPVLIDFGAARQSLSGMTQSVMSVLTAGYAPIEQYATGGNQGPWTDLYAIGAVAYRALSGKKPIDAISRIRDDPMVPAAALGQGRYTEHFLAAIDWSLSVNPEDRPASITEFKLALDGAKTPPAVAPPPSASRSDITPLAQLPMPDVSMAADKTVITRMMPAGPAKPGWVKPVAIGGALLVLAAAAYFTWRPKAPEVATAPTPAPAVRAEPAPVQPQVAPAPVPAPSAPAPQAQVRAPATATPAPKKAEPTKAPPANVPPALAAAPAPAPASAPAASPAPAPVAAAPETAKAPANSKLKPVAQMPALSSFQDCAHCPMMIALAPATFQMGARQVDNGNAWEGPSHAVTLRHGFAMGRTEVTVAEWAACASAQGCTAIKEGPASGDPQKAPAVNVNWSDALAYAAWLSKTTGRHYRLPSEAEWEYAIRAGTTDARYWGGDRRTQCQYGNGADQSALRRDPKLQGVECNDGFAALAPVGSLLPNAFGFYDMAGNAWEWTQDCWRDTYAGAPTDGSALQFPSCDQRVIRGGSWRARPNSLRSFGRGNTGPDVRSEDLGLRVVAE